MSHVDGSNTTARVFAVSFSPSVFFPFSSSIFRAELLRDYFFLEKSTKMLECCAGEGSQQDLFGTGDARLVPPPVPASLVRRELNQVGNIFSNYPFLIKSRSFISNDYSLT